jgi:signal peptidase
MGSTELTGAVPLAPRAERHRSPARRLGRAVDGIQFLARLVLATLACMVVVSVVPALFGWRSYVVLSGSMSPSMRVGDVVIAAPAGANDLAAGRVVAFREPGRLGRIIVHRVQGWRADGTLIT